LGEPRPKKRDLKLKREGKNLIRDSLLSIFKRSKGGKESNFIRKVRFYPSLCRFFGIEKKSINLKKASGEVRDLTYKYRF